jgi:hypothetical protein
MGRQKSLVHFLHRRSVNTTPTYHTLLYLHKISSPCDNVIRRGVQKGEKRQTTMPPLPSHQCKLRETNLSVRGGGGPFFVNLYFYCWLLEHPRRMKEDDQIKPYARQKTLDQHMYRPLLSGHCNILIVRCSTQLGTPRGRYDEHSSKFTSVVKTRLNRTSRRKPNFRR